ncbi:MAG: tRNA dihydrouridine(20/20a) synthase DusA [Pseudomonadales bacterium]|nr:tRNA dihydrouridine(20/20a) synthase DusA [Pseudomonadales bacterium]
MTAALNHRFCVAPMLDWTDRHERYFLRLLSKQTMLYTEMITSAALVRGGKKQLLKFNPAEHPLAIQLGGSDPEELRQAAIMAAEEGYDEINLNIGCPSDRVQAGRFGACLMAEPHLVADCIAAMQSVVSVPVTVKSRIGIDDQDSDEFLQKFIETVAAAGCSTFIIHARIALLKGLSPKENREIPPLDYDRVRRMKARYPALEIILNGGIDSLAKSKHLLSTFDGVMLGREIYQNPYLLAEVDQQIYGLPAPVPGRQEVLENFLPYIAQELALGTPLQCMTRHILGLFRGMRGGKQFRRYLSEHAFHKTADLSILQEAMACLPSNVWIPSRQLDKEIV